MKRRPPLVGGASNLERTKGRSGFPAVARVPLEGITVGSHTLTAQAEQLESLTRRVGARLAHWLYTTSVARTLPPTEWIEVFRYYQAAVLGLLKEQRERAKLTAGEHPTDEQLHEQFRDELAKALETFSPEERRYAMELWANKTVATGEVQ